MAALHDGDCAKLLQRPCEPVTIEQERRTLSTRNLDELERDFEHLERLIVPALNKMRGMLGKRPLIVPKG